MSFANLLEGAAFFTATWGAVAAAALLIVRRRYPQLVGAPRVLAFAVLVTGGIVASHLVPGILGILTREGALVAALGLLTAACCVSSINRDPDAAPAPYGSSRASWLLALVPVGAIGLWALALGAHLSISPTIHLDALSFHLPNIARWIQSGSFWQVDQFNPLLANGYYPQHGDVVFLSAVLPWNNDAYAQLLNLPYLGLTGLCVYAIAREIGASGARAALAAALFTSLPVVLLTAQKGAQTDLVMLAAFGTGVLFLLRHFRNGRRGELALAGISLGLAFGTKWYGVSSVALVLVVWIAATLAAGRQAGSTIRQAVTLTSLVGLAGGFWLLRNWVEVGNPVFPVRVSLAGITVFDAPRDPIRECAGFTIAHYLGDPGPWREFILPEYADNFGLPGLALALGLAAAVMLAVADRAGRTTRNHQLVLALAGTTAILVVAYALTPYTALGPEGSPRQSGANTRYVLPALLLSAALVAWAIQRGRRLRLPAEVLAAAAALQGLRAAFALPLGLVVEVSLLLVLLGAAAYAGARLARGLPRVIHGAAACLAIAALLGIAHLRQQDFNEGRYVGVEPALDWIVRHAPRGHTVGLAGSWDNRGLAPIYPAFGPRLGNEVAYVGKFVRGQLREYPTRERWAEALESGGFDLLIVSTKGYNEECPVPGTETDEHAWARTEGFPVLASSERLTLYRVTSRSDRRPAHSRRTE